MNTSQAEIQARDYLASVSRGPSSPADYDRALRKAAASFDQLHEAVRLAAKNDSVEQRGDHVAPTLGAQPVHTDHYA
jgi:hypothetical protein